jgi:DNA-binding NtrC family response regulator
MDQPADLTGRQTPRPDGLVLLLVDADDVGARKTEEALRGYLPTLHIRRVRKITEARDFLAEQEADLILLDEDLPDSSDASLPALLDSLSSRVPVIVQTRADGEEAALAAMKAGASDWIRKEVHETHLHALPGKLLEAVRRHELMRQRDEQVRHRELDDLLSQLRAAIARVHHQMNNPLSIISGNAQLLMELGRMLDLDQDVIQPIQDIEEATVRLAGLLHEFDAISKMIPRV